MNNARKILLLDGWSRMTFRWGMKGEILSRLLEDQNNEIYYLECGNAVKGYCHLNKKGHIGYCRNCKMASKKIIEALNCDRVKVLTMQKFKAPKFPKFETIDDLIQYDFEGYNYGLAAASSCMSMSRDYAFDIKKWNKTIQKQLQTEYTVFKNLEKLDEEYKFDEIWTFNGRIPLNYPCISYSKKHNKPYVTYEIGGAIDRIYIIKKSVSHDMNNRRREILEYWENAPSDKIEKAQKWYNDRRKGKYQSIASFTKDQKKDLLPQGFDESKENIAIFNSSMDEIFAFDTWKLPLADTENEILTAIFERFKDDDNKHFYLRLHPNLFKAKRKKTTQMVEIEKLKGKYKNLTVIEPNEKVDTYALMDAVDKVLSIYSTAGCEATYWGTTSILAGIAMYDVHDCVYQAKSFDELFKLIDTKDLPPKPKEMSYPFAYYYGQLGEECKYYKAKAPNEGSYLGLEFVGKKIK